MNSTNLIHDSRTANTCKPAIAALAGSMLVVLGRELKRVLVSPHFLSKTTSGWASSDVRIRGIVAFLCVFDLNERNLGLDKGNHPTPEGILRFCGAPQFCENGCSSDHSVSYGGGLF
jgi:hypothetical protein